jgi:hypothetical protein
VSANVQAPAPCRRARRRQRSWVTSEREKHRRFEAERYRDSFHGIGALPSEGSSIAHPRLAPDVPISIDAHAVSCWWEIRATILGRFRCSMTRSGERSNLYFATGWQAFECEAISSRAISTIEVGDLAHSNRDEKAALPSAISVGISQCDALGLSATAA